MGQPNALPIIAAARETREWPYKREWLYKADHPRHIDQHIDYFGTGVPRRETAEHGRERRAAVPGVSARTMHSVVRGLVAALVLGTAMGGCAGLVGTTGSASPSTSTASRPPSSPTPRPVDGEQAQRLQRVMTPLIKAMDHPLPLNEIKVGIMDDPQINAASAGGGEFYVTRGLLEKANDQHLAGVLAHELAHDDLRHVAKAQALGTGLTIGMVLLDQIIPGSGAIASIPGKLLMNRYTQSEEYAADTHGMEILRKAGMSPAIMADTLTWLMQTEGSSSGGFFSTHPATTDRIEALRTPR